jgi:hypothetical protein
MLADAEEVHARLLGEGALVRDVADRLGVRERLTRGVAVPVAEGVKGKTDFTPLIFLAVEWSS